MHSKQALVRLAIISCVLLLGIYGCVAPSSVTDTPGLTATASPTAPYPTVATRRPTPTAVPTLQPRWTLPPLPTLDIEFLNTDIILEASSPDCSLPCWQGLRVGESGREEVEAMFQKVFHLDNTYNIFASADRRNIPGQTKPVKRISLGSSSQVMDYFSVEVWLEDKTYLLKAIDIFWHSHQASQRVTPQRVIEERGQPLEMRVSLEPVQSPGPDPLAVFDLLMIYQDGLELQFQYGVAPYFRTLNDRATIHMVYCLSDEAEDWGALTIVEPLPAGLDSLDPIQDLLIPDRVQEGYFNLSFQEVFGVTLSDLTQRVQSGEQVCLDGGAPMP